MPERLDPVVMAMVAAREFFDGAIVNLGIGLPLECSNHVPEGMEVLFHSEQGIVGFGRLARDPSEVDPLLVNAGSQPILPRPGMCFTSHEESFAMVRSGHIDITMLGAHEIDRWGNLANAFIPGKPAPSLGGGPDLAVCAKRCVIVMRHTTGDGRPRIVERCSMGLTAPKCVDRVVTDIAVLDVDSERGAVTLSEYAPGWSVEEIQAFTGVELVLAPGLKEIRL